MSEERILVVTVGKSLFSSATWRAENHFDFRGYRRWCEELDAKGKPFWLQNPERRAKDDATCQKIGNIVKDKAPSELSRLVTITDSDEPRRYCAELTTLLAMYRAPGHHTESFQSFLSGYGAVDLVCPTDERDEAHIAARQLEQILLAQGAKNASGSLLKKILRSEAPRHRVKQWGEYLDALTKDKNNIDLVVTGGYKGFALLAGDAWARTGSELGWRVIYLHQDKEEDLFVHENGAVLALAPGEPPEIVRPKGRTL